MTAAKNIFVTKNAPNSKQELYVRVMMDILKYLITTMVLDVKVVGNLSWDYSQIFIVIFFNFSRIACTKRARLFDTESD